MSYTMKMTRLSSKSADCFKRDDEINSETDLLFILRTISFWGVIDVPSVIAPWLLHNSLDATVLAELCSSFPEYYQILRDLVRVRESDTERAIEVAIYFGFGIHVIQLLYSKGAVLCPGACAAAANVNDLPMLQYLHEQNCPWNSRTTMNAICRNNMHILQFAFIHGCPLPDNSMMLAARYGSVEVMKFLRSVGVAYPAVIYQDIYNLASIQHLRSVGCDWNVNSCEEYAMEGALECLKYAHENGCPWDEHVCAAAARHGHLECLQYAHEQKCPWDARTVQDAAHYGEYECLQYAHQQGCPVNFKATSQAFAHGQWRCLVYLMWHCFFPTAIPVVTFLYYALLSVSALILECAKDTIAMNDYTQLVSNLCWTTQYAMFIFGPHYFNDFPLRVKVHIILMGAQLVVRCMLLLSNLTLYEGLALFGG